MIFGLKMGKCICKLDHDDIWNLLVLLIALRIRPKYFAVPVLSPLLLYTLHFRHTGLLSVASAVSHLRAFAHALPWTRLTDGPSDVSVSGLDCNVTSSWKPSLIRTNLYEAFFLYIFVAFFILPLLHSSRLHFLNNYILLNHFSCLLPAYLPHLRGACLVHGYVCPQLLVKHGMCSRAAPPLETSGLWSKSQFLHLIMTLTLGKTPTLPVLQFPFL